MRYRFGPFELDPAHSTLTRRGRQVRLTRQPLRLLALLVESRGGLVTRDAIRAHLWDHPFVEADQGINQCVRKIRAALGDEAERPLFIETVPRRGYRFICPVETVPTATERSRRGRTGRTARSTLILLAGAAGAALATGLLVVARTSEPGGAPPAGTAGVPASGAGELGLALAGADAQLDRRRTDLVARAVERLETAVSDDPGRSATRLRLAVAYSTLHWYSGQADAARSARLELRRAEALGGAAGSLWFTRGVLSYHDRDYRGALTAFDRARSFEPRGLDARLGADLDLMTGKTLRRLGRWDEAQSALLRAYEAEPTSFEITYAVASTARYTRDHQLAARFLERAADLDPSHWVLWAIRPADALRAHGDTAAAARLARESAARIGFGWLLASSRSLARVLASTAVAEDPPFEGPEAYRGAYHLSMAEAYRLAGLPRRALDHYRAAARVLEDQIEAGSWPESYRGQPLSYLAAAEAGLGRLDRAEELATAALVAMPMGVDAVAGSRVAVQVAQTLVTIGQIERAAGLVEELLARPSPLTLPLLRTDPVWAPLLAHPRIRAALAERGPPPPRAR